MKPTPPDEWSQIRAIVELALDSDAADRDALIERACAAACVSADRVRAYLAQDAPSAALDEPAPIDLEGMFTRRPRTNRD